MEEDKIAYLPWNSWGGPAGEILILVPPFTSCGEFATPHFNFLNSKIVKIIVPTSLRFLWRLNNLLHVKSLEQSLEYRKYNVNINCGDVIEINQNDRMR